MPFIRVTLSSPKNINVQGTRYFEVDPEDLDENGEVPEDRITEAWQEAVNDYLSDTYIDIVENDGD